MSLSGYTGLSLADYKAGQQEEEAAREESQQLQKQSVATILIYKEKQQEADNLKKEMDKSVSDAEKPFRDRLATTSARLTNATLKINEPYPQMETFFSDFGLPVFKKTLTDADGKFSISYPQDRAFSVFAKAQRMIGDKTEKYCWLVNAPSGADVTQLLLSNNNLVLTDPDGYFKTKPSPEE